MLNWLIQQGVIKKLAENILQQGFSILLLIIAVWWLTQQNKSDRAEMRQEVIQLKVEIQSCQNQILQYYREDRKETDLIMERATNIMTQIESKLK